MADTAHGYVGADLAAVCKEGNELFIAAVQGGVWALILHWTAVLRPVVLFFICCIIL